MEAGLELRPDDATLCCFIFIAVKNEMWCLWLLFSLRAKGNMCSCSLPGNIFDGACFQKVSVLFAIQVVIRKKRKIEPKKGDLISIHGASFGHHVTMLGAGDGSPGAGRWALISVCSKSWSGGHWLPGKHRASVRDVGGGDGGGSQRVWRWLWRWRIVREAEQGRISGLGPSVRYLPGSGWGMCSSVPPSPNSYPGRRSCHAFVSEQKADKSLQPRPGILLWEDLGV